ncbi:hypothetical protein AB751O23_AN_00220 [Chlamydiales bacterium SCGC AB-751-O23]|jgi:hypothetical protein|nr:hypothetical protein AB751O23_AN_00220 [Chlamydiales bacterium SCGC AB-751-O23]
MSDSLTTKSSTSSDANITSFNPSNQVSAKGDDTPTSSLATLRFDLANQGRKLSVSPGVNQIDILFNEGFKVLNNKKGAYLGEKEKLFQIQKSLKKIPGAQKIINGNNETLEASLKQLMTGEILSKSLAYINFNLLKDEERFIEIPICSNDQGCFRMQKFKVETIFVSRSNIPCWGLVPVGEQKTPLINSSTSPIVLWRGTVPNDSAPGGIASVLINFDDKGPAYRMFNYNKKRLAIWLYVRTQNGQNKARTMGHSQGAALATYTAVELAIYISTDFKSPSYAWSTPGINKEHLDRWNALPSGEKPALVTAITKTDPVSKIGECVVSKLALFITSYVKNLSPLSAHCSILTPNSSGVFITAIDLEKENSKIARRLWVSLKGVRAGLFLGQRNIIKISRIYNDIAETNKAIASGVKAIKKRATDVSNALTKV